ncbi:MAG: hypothetical protein DRO95_05210 [Candidatus Altiarchaeales archaeon]|nr:MAG: hypothetical protein DRO95_05210 [Candidatus Altiarchaeales archaeon]
MERKMYKLGVWLLVIMLTGIAFADLGTFEPGDSVIYSVVCHTDEGVRDAGCTYVNVTIINPDGTEYGETAQMSEVNEAKFPGLWSGTFDIPSDAISGIWRIYISLTNSNGTTGATVREFQVITDRVSDEDISDLCTQANLTQGIVVLTSTTETQIDNIEADTNELQINQNWNVWDDSVRTLTSCPCTSEISDSESNIISHGDKYWNTSTLTASEIWSYATRTLTDYSGVWSVTSRTLTAFTFAVDLSTSALDSIDARINQSHGTGLYNATAIAQSDINSIVDAVWDEAQSEHTSAGTFGYYLDRQVSAVDTDVWNYTLGTNRSTARTLNDTYNLLFLWGGSGW